MKIFGLIAAASAASALVCRSTSQGDTPTDIPKLLKSLGPAPENDPRWTAYKKPGSNDVRSPCPGLNTLANHGFIHRDGRNMTIPHLLQGLSAGLNMGPDFITVIGSVGLLSSPNPLGGSFDLNHLAQHNFPLEHDASLSRQDAYFGNPSPFQPKIWSAHLSQFNGAPRTTIPTASKAKYSRFNDSLTRNPEFTYGFKEAVVSYGDVGLYVQSMSDPVSGSADLRYVRSLFEQEKLPYALGWRPSTAPITLLSLGNMAAQFYAASPQPVFEGAVITAQSYKDVLTSIAGGANIIRNLTGGISDYLNIF